MDRVAPRHEDWATSTGLRTHSATRDTVRLRHGLVSIEVGAA
jgi:hypothetical protein